MKIKTISAILVLAMGTIGLVVWAAAPGKTPAYVRVDPNHAPGDTFALTIPYCDPDLYPCTGAGQIGVPVLYTGDSATPPFLSRLRADDVNGALDPAYPPGNIIPLDKCRAGGDLLMWGGSEGSPNYYPKPICLPEGNPGDVLTVTADGNTTYRGVGWAPPAGGPGAVVWGDIGGDLINQTDLAMALDGLTDKTNKIPAAGVGNITIFGEGGDIADSTVPLADAISALGSLGSDIGTINANKPDRISSGLGNLAQWDADGNLVTGPAAASILPDTIGTAKGQLIGFSSSATPGVLDATTNGYVLTLDSTTTLGFRWAASAVAGDTVKMNKIGSPTDGYILTMTAAGDAASLGHGATYFATAGHTHTGIYEPAFGATVKSNKVGGTPTNHIAKLTASGDLADGGTLGTASHSAAGDFATSGHTHAGDTVKSNKVGGSPTNHLAKLTASGDLADGSTLGTAAHSATGDFATASHGHVYMFGDGNDGSTTLSGNLTLTRDMMYNNLTVPNGVTLSTVGYVLYVSGTLTVGASGVIHCDGGAGGNGAAGTGGAGANPPYLINSNRPWAMVPAYGPAASNVVSAGTLNGTGPAALASTLGATYCPGTFYVGGGGSSGGGHGNAAVNGTAGFASICGGAGGAGGAGTGTGSTGPFAGGGGGAGGGLVLIYANTINNAGVIRANGGKGGGGQTSGSDKSGNGGGGGGGSVIIYYRSTTGSGVGSLTATCGGAGTGGNGGACGNAGRTASIRW